jgi:hypothetical protein
MFHRASRSLSCPSPSAPTSRPAARSSAPAAARAFAPSAARAFPALAAAAAAALTLAAPAVAHAELSEEAKGLTFRFRDYQIAVRDAKALGFGAKDQFRETPESCVQLIEQAKALGVGGGELISGVDGNYPFKKTAELCASYRTWKLNLDGAAVLDKLTTMVPNIETLEPGLYGETAIRNWALAAQECLGQLETVVAAGADAAQPIKDINHQELSLAQGRALCQRVVGWSEGFAEETKKLAKAKADAIRAKYTKVGIGGERLDTFVHYDNVQWMASGCAAENDLKRLKRAAVLFQWLEHSDGTYGVRRFQFRGDKLLRTTEQRYLTSAAATRGCR